jgi:FkbM family methyltransferase
MYYSQFGEDVILSSYFNNNYKGVCVEVGADDGISGSNTYHFEKKGWNCICVEPVLESYNKCKLIRDNVINCCISDYNKDNVDFSVVTLNNTNTSAISSLKIDDRLITSHESHNPEVYIVKVNVRTLTSIFKDNNFPIDIDFISIDTENTELDVVKGIRFDEYNIKFLVIENNFNEPFVEEYLILQNFKKIKRNAVNDIYVNNNYINSNIFNKYNIVNANYYINENINNGNVTDLIKLLFKKYEQNPLDNNNILVCNETFTDTIINSKKQLFISIKNTKTFKQYKYTFDEGETIYLNNIFNELNNDNSTKKKGIFYNSKKAMYSIWETGNMIYQCLKLSNMYTLDYTEDVQFKYHYDFAIVNEHFTVNNWNWITKEMINLFNKPIFCIVTEVSLKSPNFYTGYLVLNSSINDNNNVYAFGRPLNNFICQQKNIIKMIHDWTATKFYKKFEGVFKKIVIEESSNTIEESSNTIEASIGEIVDKYSILELKTKYIFDVIKLQEIKREMDMLYKNIDLSQFSYFYKLLLYINEQIWIDTDIIKSITLNADNVSLFAETSNNIFINNQKRFRLKTYFNVLHNSSINEQKGYKNNICFIDIDNENDIYNKIPEINYLLISYDIIYFSLKYKTIINTLFINPNIEFVVNPNIELVDNANIELVDNANIELVDNTNIELVDNLNIYLKVYTLQTFCIDPTLSSIYDFEHISYLSGGKLGDFINQLSVISETFYDTGKKGILYIDNIGDTFTFGLENTYNDTYNSITSQKFIKDYKMYNNEIININLSSWRTNFITTNWHNIFKNKYNVSWGKHTWLSGTIDTKWNNKTIINVTPYRFLLQNTIHKLTEIVNADISNCIFISNEDAHYKYFCENTGINIEHYQPNSFDEIVTIVNSCKMAYLGLSSMATIANALHKKHILLSGGSDTALNNLTGIMQHMIDII